jgi:hypothetical protein
MKRYDWQKKELLENIKWFSKLTSSEKIRFIEKERERLAFFRTLIFKGRNVRPHSIHKRTK